MIKHYLMVAWRQFARQRAYSVLTILGLGLGLACFLVTTSWLRFETSYDRDWPNGDRIVRVIGKQGFATGDFHIAPMPFNLAPVLAAEFPEFGQVARVQAPASLLFAVGEKRFYESSVYYADSNILEIFALPLQRGDRATVLRGPDKVVLSDAVARRYFGDEDPLGKSIRLDNRVDLTVSGVLEPLPQNLSFRPEIVVTMSTHAATAAGTYLHDWRTNAYHTFALLRSSSVPIGTDARFVDILQRFRPDGTPPQLQLQPIREMHLTPNLQSDFGIRRAPALLWMFGLTALFVLIIACVNYTNLATARALNRDREIGVRKVLGAGRPRLIAQFLGESLLTAGAATAFSLVVAELLMIAANRWLGSPVERFYALDLPSLGIIVAVWLLVGLGAGLYPALWLSALRPAITIRRDHGSASLASVLRNGLVIVQFVASIVLIISTFTVYRQLEYFNSRDLGYNRSQIITVPLAGQELKDLVPALKAALGSHAAVQSITAIGSLPSSAQQSSASFNWENGPPDQQLLFNLNVVDEDYLATFGIQLVAGRNFDPTQAASENSLPCLINETAATRLGWTDPVGRNLIQPPDLKINVIGVMKDYNYASLHLPIRPLMLFMDPTRPTNLAIKVASNNLSTTLAELQQLWTQVAPSRPFNYSFLDDSFAASYQSEQTAGSILLMYTILAVLIASLGLISLTSYRIARRTKETGIRKVLGASIGSLISLHLREFVVGIVIAGIIAAPIGYFAMQSWLSNFAFRVDIAWWTFVLAGLGALMAAILTVLMQTTKAATANPVQSLRYE